MRGGLLRASRQGVAAACDDGDKYTPLPPRPVGGYWLLKYWWYTQPAASVRARAWCCYATRVYPGHGQYAQIRTQACASCRDCSVAGGGAAGRQRWHEGAQG